jgi:flagellar biosynthesis/type III secretory pathway protein FliH
VHRLVIIVSDLRDFIKLVEHFYSAPLPVETPVEPEVIEEGESVEDRLADLAFKLRAHSEMLNEAVDEEYASGYSLGVEAGCEMAAEMIDNLIRQLSGANNEQ